MKLQLQGPEQKLAERVQRRREKLLPQKAPGQHRKIEGLLYSDLYYVLKIREASQRFRFSPRIAQSLVKPSKAQTMSPLPPALILELLEHGVIAQGFEKADCPKGSV